MVILYKKVLFEFSVFYRTTKDYFDDVFLIISRVHKCVIKLKSELKII